MYNIAILASGSGTNAENIVRTFNEGDLLRVRIVLTDHADAGVVERMRRLGVKTAYVPGRVWKEHPEEVVKLLKANDTDLVVLAGFMRLVSPVIVAAFPGRILNLHPSLLPKYGGKGMWGHHVHEAVMAAGEKESGVTVHYVNEEYDRGEILMQERVEIVDGDTPESLEAKIHQAEYRLYPRAITEALRRLGNPGQTPPKLPENAADAPKVEDIPEAEVVAEVIDVIPEGEKPATSESRQTPPPVDGAAKEENVDQQWADALKIKYDPKNVPPPIPEEEKVPENAPETPQRLSDEGMPPNYLVLSVIMTLLCCFIPGIVALIYSSKVSNRFYAGDIEGARRASRLAQIWIIVSFCLGVIWSTLYLPMTLISSAMGL